VNLLEEVSEHCKSLQLTMPNATKAIAMTITPGPVCDAGDLMAYRAYTGVLKLTFRVWR
jgi:hypothetical protein